MHRLEDGRVLADVRARGEAQTPDQAAGQVAEDVAEQVGGDEHVELVRVLDQLHGAVVDDHLLELDVRVLRRQPPARLEEQAARALEDVRLVHQRQPPALVLLHVVEGVLDDPLAPLAGDDRDALGGRALVVDVVLDAGIEALRVLADHHQIDAAVSRLDAGEAPCRAHVRVEIELLAQRDVRAAIALADGRGQRPLERELVAPDGLERLRRNRSPMGGHRAGARRRPLPLDLASGGLDHLDGGVDDLRTDAVAGDERDSNRHGRRA